MKLFSFRVFIANTIYFLFSLWCKFKRRKLNKSVLRNRLRDLRTYSYLKKESLLSDLNLKVEIPYLRILEEVNSIKVDLDLLCTQVFNDQSIFQSGALEDEIDYVLAIALSLKPAKVLEIGVANGYSSSVLQQAINNMSSTECQFVRIDMPRFENIKKTTYQKMLKFSYKYGTFNKQLSHTVYDLKEGGVVPLGRYAGWLIPIDTNIQSSNLYGNAFNILPYLKRNDFDLIIIDAMKDQTSRANLLDECYKLLSKGGLIILDGEWINSAMLEFAEKNQLFYQSYGRLGIVSTRYIQNNK